MKPDSPPDLLRDFTPEERAALGDLTELTGRLAAYTVPDPTPADSLRLLQAVRAAQQAATPPPPAIGWREWLRLARAQFLLMPPGFWAACLIIVGIGVGVASSAGGGSLVALLVLGAPLLAVAGVAYAFAPETRGLHDLERLSPMGWWGLLYVRMGLVLAFTSALSLAVMVVIGISGAEVTLWRLFVVWLGPMLGLTGLALYLSARWNGWVGLIVPLGLWAGLVLLGWREAATQAGTGGLPSLRSLAGWLSAQIGSSDVLIGAAGIAGLFGLWLMISAGRGAAQQV